MLTLGRVQRRATAVALNGLLLVICFLVLTPMLLALSTALKAPGESYVNPGLIPRRIDFTKFVDVYYAVNLPVLALNSLIVTTATVSLLLLLASLAAYAFARLDFAAK